jgi:hypothetical protein
MKPWTGRTLNASKALHDGSFFRLNCVPGGPENENSDENQQHGDQNGWIRLL